MLLPPSRSPHKAGQTQRTALLLEDLAEAGADDVRSEAIAILTDRTGNELASRELRDLIDRECPALTAPSAGSVRNWRLDVARLNGDWRRPVTLR